ncbi:MAG: PilN domain-containing protein [Terracidiphilus sp.]
MRVTLNLATRPFTDLGPALKRLRIGMGVLVALSLLFLLGLHLFDSQAKAARAREHSLDGAIASIDTERQSAQAFMQEPYNAQLLKQTEFLNERFDEKSFSWTLAMEAMETVLPGGVQVTSIEPQRAKDGHITVQLRVIGPHDKSVDLMRNLEHSRRFLAPRIESESAESSNSGPNQRLEPVSVSNRFEIEISADYNPPTPEERAALNPPSSAAKSAKNAAPAATARPRHSGALPALPRNRKPYTGPAQLPQKPSPALKKPSPAQRGGRP